MLFPTMFCTHSFMPSTKLKFDVFVSANFPIITPQPSVVVFGNGQMELKICVYLIKANIYKRIKLEKFSKQKLSEIK